MKMAKILLSVVVIMALMLSATTAFAAENQFKARLAGDAEIVEGTKTVKVKVQVYDVDKATTNNGLAASGGEVVFDNTKVEPVIDEGTPKAALEEVATVGSWTLLTGPAEAALNDFVTFSAMANDNKTPIDVDNESSVVFEFTLKDTVKVGDKIEFTLRNLSMTDNSDDVLAANGTIPNPTFTMTVVEKPEETEAPSKDASKDESKAASEKESTPDTGVDFGSTVLWAVLALAAAGCLVVSFTAKKATK